MELTLKMKQLGLEPNMHLTCTNVAKADVVKALKTCRDNGVANIMFFDASTYGAFLKECRKCGIDVPVVPGIMLVQAAGGFRKMTTMCKTRASRGRRQGRGHARVRRRELKSYGVDLGVEMSHQLLKYGAPGLHFYTLNLEKSTLAIADRVARTAKAKAKGEPDWPSSRSASPPSRAFVDEAEAAQPAVRGAHERRGELRRHGREAAAGQRAVDDLRRLEGVVGEDDLARAPKPARPGEWKKTPDDAT
ncbi:methylenetetrahydrofolate reductase (NAD(P)H) [Aureococcus anophagefferens]|uniref:Methylenetetrahydrofolate reductase (NAD(P)H) n=1 Tax=Aureococcus anophagefferens TaxID=44056 RepID=A0ABR1G6E2_AURAN